MTIGSEMSMLLDAFEEPRLLLREDLTVAFANRAFRARYGVRNAEGRRCHEVLFHEMRPCAECGCDCPVVRAFVSGQPFRSVQHRFVPGGERFVELAATPILRTDGRVEYVMETLRERRSSDELIGGAGIVAESAAVRRMLTRIARVCARDEAVLFTGREGVGKGVFARFLHENSRRAAQGFVRIDCAELTPEIFEREFFGSDGEAGLLDALAGGTVYFDGVGALSLPMQSRLLELIETGRLRRSGAASVRTSNFRILCSSSEDLASLAARGRFRRDLLYRLGVCTVPVPALEERRDDMGELAALILRRVAPERALRLSEEALEYLRAREWPGNVREFICFLERVSIELEGDVVTLSACLGDTAGNASELPGKEVSAVSALASQWKGSRRALAERLGISERTLYRRLRAEAQSVSEGVG